ncbi:MAG: HI1506-related protein [Methylobacter sp.]|nr:HI1506-related protein [Methylobacter sp.]MDP2099832.1 HI1506-related protein [Methylobacter sp.]MDP2427952.1 HI1506-related protein [Methylobacter sp.]MDP3054212.1 HI1506-related protein [Methylobacter sp.]MDP3361127.1 HI1506-related protein [Methylobacter sp.]
MVTIKSLKNGFRRCGIAHPATPVEYEDGHFTDDQLAALKQEPMLSVTVTEDKPEKTGKAK